MRRLLAFALVLLLAFALPMREAGGSERETSPAKADASARTDGPIRAIKVVPHVVPGASGTVHGRPASEALASASSSYTPPDDSFSSSVPAGRFRLHLAPPLRDFPLLI